VKYQDTWYMNSQVNVIEFYKTKKRKICRYDIR